MGIKFDNRGNVVQTIQNGNLAFSASNFMFFLSRDFFGSLSMENELSSGLPDPSVEYILDWKFLNI